MTGYNMNKSTLIGQLRPLLNQSTTPSNESVTGVIGNFGNEYSFDVIKMADRSELIETLRYALGLAENPNVDVAEFELLGNGFCFEQT